jgi:pantoate kinase
VLKHAKAFSPAGISSFFEICDRMPNGKPITNPEKIGARGGGFSPDRGVFTEVFVTENEHNEIQVLINGVSFSEAETTKSVVEAILKKAIKKYCITVKHQVEVPIGAGFGSSAAGALGTSLALSKALNLNLTYNQSARIAHISEVKCKTGLGTVGPLLHGGCGLTLEPGAPGIARLDRIPISPDYKLIIGTFRPHPTKKILSLPKKRKVINEWGQKTLIKILSKPSLDNFMDSCKKFALETGFATKRVKMLMEDCEKVGAVGAAQNMLGEAVHALVKLHNLDAVHKVFQKYLPEEKIIVANIDFQGARIIN